MSSYPAPNPPPPPLGYFNERNWFSKSDPTGPVGPQGVQGGLGPVGVQGFQGRQGLQGGGGAGTQGNQGFQGLGTQGNQGVQGTAGGGGGGGTQFYYIQGASITPSQYVASTTAVNVSIPQASRVDGTPLASLNGQYWVSTMYQDSASTRRHYYSTDFGLNFTLAPLPYPSNMTTMSISATGQYMYCGAYRSQDWGATWALMPGAVSAGLSSYDLSATEFQGSKVVLATGATTLTYLSLDYGNTFTLVDTRPATGDYLVYMALGGNTLVVSGRSTGGFVSANRISNDGGTTWFTSLITGGADTPAIRCVSASGQYMYATVQYNVKTQLFYSVDYGVSWQVNNFPGLSINGACCSASGQYVAFPPNNQSIYISCDFGKTFTQVSTAGSVVSNAGVGINSTGQYFITQQNFPANANNNMARLYFPFAGLT